ALGITKRQVLALIEDGSLGSIDISKKNAVRKEKRIPVGEYARFLTNRASIPARAYTALNPTTQPELF
ncbi:MAG: hypothetical protein LBV12_08785, partial [Puniceicoccales bacterium]|nr:hypothetical protein [Puniceicoccales bacterium]